MHLMNEQAGIVEGIPVLPVLARPAYSSGAEASQREGEGTGPSGAEADAVRQSTPMQQQQQAPKQVRSPATAACVSVSAQCKAAAGRLRIGFQTVINQAFHNKQCDIHALSAAAHPCTAYVRYAWQ